jgi:hypothetical protein
MYIFAYPIDLIYPIKDGNPIDRVDIEAPAGYARSASLQTSWRVLASYSDFFNLFIRRNAPKSQTAVRHRSRSVFLELI